MHTVKIYQLNTLSPAHLRRLRDEQIESERRIRDLRHKATRQVVTFCVENEVGTVFIGNPHGVRQRNGGKHHNQRMALWECGKDLDYLAHKSKQAHMSSFTGSERGTSSHCPSCGHQHKPKKSCDAAKKPVTL